MNEIIFLVEETDGNKYTAAAIGRAIFIGAHSWDELKSLAKNSIPVFLRAKHILNQFCYTLPKKK